VNGFLYPFNALSATDVARYREALRATEAHLGGSLMDVDRKYRGNMHFLCRWVDELIHLPAILDVVEDLIGPDILLYTSRFFIKEPRTESIAAWHQDSTYFGLRPYEHVTAWVALSNVPKETGPMEFAVGSHIRGQLQQRSNVVKNSVNTAGQIIVEWFDQSQTEFGVLAPGQFSRHHTCTVHQSGPNNSDQRRVGLALSLSPLACVTSARSVCPRVRCEAKIPTAILTCNRAHSRISGPPKRSGTTHHSKRISIRSTSSWRWWKKTSPPTPRRSCTEPKPLSFPGYCNVNRCTRRPNPASAVYKLPLESIAML